MGWELFEQRKAAGLCRTGCGRRLVTKNHCRECANKEKARVDVVKASGMCAACKKRKRVNATLCRTCRKTARASLRNWRAKKVAAGVCLRCEKPVSKTCRDLCEEHRLEDNARAVAKAAAARALLPARDPRPVRQQRLEAGLCETGCGRKIALASKFRCQKCLAKGRKALLKYRLQKLAAGTCVRCKDPIVPASTQHCEKHRLEQAAANRKSHEKRGREQATA